MHMKKNKEAWGQYGTANVGEVCISVSLEGKIKLTRLVLCSYNMLGRLEYNGTRERANMQSPYPLRLQRETSSMTDTEAIMLM